MALTSSWPWLVQPDIRPGLTAPFDAVAPKDARVVDREALKQQRSSLVPSTLVQVIDDQQDQQLRMRLERYLGELERVARSDDADRIGPVNLSTKEQQWLEERSAEERLRWDMALRRALERMLSQGLVKNLAEEQLRQATSLQLEALGTAEAPSRTLGSKLLTKHGQCVDVMIELPQFIQCQQGHCGVRTTTAQPPAHGDLFNQIDGGAQLLRWIQRSSRLYDEIIVVRDVVQCSCQRYSRRRLGLKT